MAVSTILIAMVSVVPTTLASWSGTGTVDAGTVESGTLNAAIAPGATVPTTGTTAALGAVTGILPGESRSATFTVRNTGNVNMTLAAAIRAGTSPYLEFDISVGVCVASPPPGAALSGTPITVSSVIAPGTNASFCLRITLAATTPNSAQNTSLGGYTIDLTAGSTP